MAAYCFPRPYLGPLPNSVPVWFSFARSRLVSGAFQFSGFSFGTVGANGGGSRPLDAPPINSFIVWRGNKVHSNGGFNLGSDGIQTPGREQAFDDSHDTAGNLAQPFTAEVVLEHNTVRDSAVPFARGSGATGVGGLLLRGNSFADENIL